ncbi:hypothetical protein MmiHf6_16300 [Methanimicrococcus hongohii]|uniref:Uncharacterized protein n=1 Tax=Methanimicrococcus hongohii TaxID=3028295 RepID=A0AA96V0W4_9EURY|nr:hypothetical protein [Methanimicrococcus sp. Hf6]WNY24299.1 hypothetical protein MmiHf6_16300 [Methanimicrococcus sp. Hf6]
MSLKKIGLIIFLLICFVFMSGCLDSSENEDEMYEMYEMKDSDINKYGLNPLHKNVSLFSPSHENIPPVPVHLQGAEGENEAVISETGYPTPMTFKELSAQILNQSETIVYVTVLEALPAVQTSPDEVYTPIIFKVDDPAVGNVSDTITVQIRGGYAENFGLVSEDGYSPTPWDFEVSDKYLLYLKNPNSNSIEENYYQLVFRGIFVVND